MKAVLPAQPITAQPEAFPAAKRRMGQRNAIRANLFTGIIQQIVLGALMMLYANDVLGYSPVRVGFIVSVAPLGMLTRFFMLRSVRQSGKVKALRRTQVVRMTIIGLLMLIPATWMTFPLFTALLCGFTLANELGTNVAWQPVLRDITTTGDRGSFFSRMRLAFTVVTALVTFLVPFVIGAAMREWEYKCLLAVAMLGAANFYYWSGKIPEARTAPDSGIPPAPALWPHLKGVLLTSPLLREPLAIALLAGFTTFPVFVLYLKAMLHVPSNLISLFLFTGTLGSALSYLVWGRVADTVGFRPMYAGLLILTLAVQPLILFIAPFPEPWNGVWGAHEIGALSALLLQGFLSGALAAGSGIAVTTIQHFCVRPDDVVESMTLYSGAVVLVSAVVAMITSAFLQTIALPAGMHIWASGWLAIDGVKAWILLTNGLLGAASLILLRRIPNSHADMGMSSFFDSVAGTLGNAVRSVPVPPIWLAGLYPRKGNDPKETSP